MGFRTVFLYAQHWSPLNNDDFKVFHDPNELPFHFICQIFYVAYLARRIAWFFFKFVNKMTVEGFDSNFTIF